MKLPSLPRAIGFGVMAGLTAIFLWLPVLQWPRLFVTPYVVALALTVIAGAYVLLSTLIDFHRNPRRGVRIRPIRAFDVGAGLVLTAPALWALWPYLPTR